MIQDQPEASARDIRTLEWQDDGDSDWSATAPGGWALSYSGPRIGLGRGYSRFSIELALARGGKAAAGLLREGAFDQFAKRVGYAVEHQTGDAAFDARIYLASDNRALAQTLADRPEIRQAVLELFDANVTSINITAGGWTARLDESPHPDDDAGGALSATALKLCALADLWPDKADLAPSPAGGWGGLRILSLVWFGVVAATVFGRWAWGGDAGWDRQIETFAETDWLGMGLLALAAVGPFALLGGRRATSHRVLLVLALSIAALLPLSERLLQIDLNRLHDRGQAVVPALPTALRIAPDRQYSKGYLVTAVIEDTPVDWALSLDEGKLALEGRLCMAGVVAEGLRGLHYVKALRTWACRPGETSLVPPLSETPSDPS